MLKNSQISITGWNNELKVTIDNVKRKLKEASDKEEMHLLTINQLTDKQT